MATNFPTSRDTLTNPTPSNTQNSPSHSGQHSDANDAIEAIEALLPITSEGAVPRGKLGYAQVTANQGSITAETDVTGLSVTVTVGSGRRIRVKGYAPRIDSTASDLFVLLIYEGATKLGEWALLNGPTFGSGAGPEVILTPTAGSHTYKLRCGRASGTGTGTVIAAADRPAFILVEDIGV